MSDLPEITVPLELMPDLVHDDAFILNPGFLVAESVIVGWWHGFPVRLKEQAKR